LLRCHLQLLRVVIAAFMTTLLAIFFHDHIVLAGTDGALQHRLSMQIHVMKMMPSAQKNTAL
tara:strand:- start:77 stop:262 length:186 start_codon:yes stop_codon:yes gene_type:complete